MQIKKDWLNSLNPKPVEKFNGSCETCEFGFEKDIDKRCLEHRKNLKKGEICPEYGVSYKYYMYLRDYITKEGRFPEGTPQKVIDFVRD